MIRFPITIISPIIGLIIAGILWYKNKKIPSIKNILLIVISVLSLLAGLSYFYIAIVAFLSINNPTLSNYQLESSKDIISMICFAGIVFIYFGITQFRNTWTDEKK